MCCCICPPIFRRSENVTLLVHILDGRSLKQTRHPVQLQVMDSGHSGGHTPNINIHSHSLLSFHVHLARRRERIMIFCSYSILSFLVLTIIESTAEASIEVPCVGRSNSSTLGYEKLPRSVQDDVFQRLFRDEDVLLSFMNAVFEDNPEMLVGEITNITVLPREPQRMFNKPQIEFDVWITDSNHQQYIIEMQREFRSFHVGRFQLYACKALIDGVRIFYQKFLEENKRVPTEREMYPNIPRLIVIVLTDKLSGKPFIPPLPRISNQKENGDDVSSTYSIYCPMEKVGSESKLNLLFIDLERFRLQKPGSSYEKWLHFMKNTKDGNFSTQLESVYENEAGIKKALAILREISPQERQKLDAAWSQLIEAEDLARSEGKAEGRAEGKAEGRAEAKVEVAKVLLEKNMTSIQEIAEITGLGVGELEDLKEKSVKM